MNQQRNNKIVMVVIGIILLFASLPCVWMTIRNAPMNFPGGLLPGLGEMNVNMTGFNGNITLLGAKFPLWFAVALGILSLLLILLNRIRVTSLPSLIILVPGAVSAIFTIFGVLIGMTSDNTTLGIGGWLAMAGLICGSIAHFTSTKETPETAAASNGDLGKPLSNSDVQDRPPQ